MLDVLVDQVARFVGQAPIPVNQHRIKLGTRLPPGTGDEQRPEDPFQPTAGSFHQRMRPAPRHAERLCQVGVVEVVPQAQLDDLALTRRQFG